MRVPKEYGKPGRGKIKIALARVPATGPREQRIGSLLWDAGGPGGVSTDMIGMMSARMSPAVQARFDFVAFDPRGIGASQPALESCGQPWPVGRPAREASPDWRRVQRLSARVLARANRACMRDAASFVQTMGTGNVARDLNRIRRTLGDEKLTFWGTSYGTRIGYVYAYLYPHRVRAMVLDGNIDPSGDYAGLPTIGGTSQDSALRFMRRHFRSGYEAIVRTAAELRLAPVPLSGGGRFTRWDWLDFTGGFTAFPAAWPTLLAVAPVVRTAQGSGPDAEAARGHLAAWKALPNSNEGGGFSVVNCLDYADRLSGRRQARIATDVEQTSPVFGGSLALQYAMGCAGLGALDPDPVPTIRTRGDRARVADVPVLIANATHDGSTPMAWAKRMQRAFDRPMIKYRSAEHVIWGGADSTCVDRPIDRFVLRQKLPAGDRVCPFVPPVTAAASAPGEWIFPPGYR